MRFFYLMVLLVCSLQFSVFSVAANVHVQFLLGDNKNGAFEGTYNITFGLYPSPNVSEAEALWKEEHQLVITQGKVSQILGTQTPLDYHLFKPDKLYVGLSFSELNDRVFVPLISVPAAVVSKYSIYAREIEYSADWMKINTQNHRVGIGITQNLTVPFQVVGSANITSVNATGGLYSPNGYNVYRLDYNKLINLDDYSLSPNDGLDSPTVDVVYVTKERHVGVGIYDTDDIQEQLHVSGNLRVDNGIFSGQSSIHLVGEGGVLENQDGNQLMWDSNQGVFRAGHSSGGTWNKNQNGNYSAAFGHDNKVSGEYGFSAGQDNHVSAIHGIVFGISNQVHHRRSSILGGESNQINGTSDPDNGGYMTIGGGKNNVLSGDYGFIGGGNGNQVLDDSKYASIVGGKDNIVNGSSDFSVILGGENNNIWGTHSIAMGKNAQIGASGAPHDGVFMFADRTVQMAQPLKSYDSNQFLVHATNGILFGLSNFNHKEPLTVSSKTYPPTGTSVKDHTIRTAGDIVAADADGNLGYLVGDGSFITNVSSVWVGDDAASSVYLGSPIRVGIGANNASTQAHSMLYVKSEGTFPPNARFESQSGETLDVGVHGANGVIETNGPLVFKQSGTDIFEITNGNDVVFKKKVGINVLEPEYALHIDGSVKITEDLEFGGMSTLGTITANAFVGDGSRITDVQVSYMVPGSSSDISGEKRLVMSNDGFVAIGQVAIDHASAPTDNPVEALLHVGDGSSTQLKLERTGESRFTTMTSGTQFDLTFHNFVNDTDKIFSIKAQKDNTATSLVMVSAKGHVGILKDPTADDALSVNGNVSATTFSGNGEKITNVQLDSDQTNPIAFEKTITFKDMLRLAPRNHNEPPSCTVEDEVGTIYSIYSGSTNSGAVAICACIDTGIYKNLIDNTNHQACQ